MALTRRNFLKISSLVAAGLGASTVAFADVKTWHKTTDVVIVGMGGAGMTTAVVAADNGANCIIIERQPKRDVCSNTRMSAGTLHTPHKACDREALKQYALAMMSGANLPWKLEADIDPKTVESSADDWAK